MERYFIVLMAVVAFASCKKEDKFDATRQAQEDDALIRSYLENNGITAEKDSSSGLYYSIIEPGFDITPSASSAVTVNYTGKLLSGSQFDSGNNVKIRLNTTIIGWQIGIPKIKKGGRLLLFIPSGLAYGRNVSEKIPENSVLVFDVTLVNVSN